MRTHLVFGSDFSPRKRPRGHLIDYNNLLRKPASSASKPLWNFILSKHHQKSYMTIYIFIYIIYIYIYMMNYIFILNPKIVKPHTISTHISSHISKHPSQLRFQEPVWRPVAPYRTKANAKATPGHTRRQGDETIFPGSQFVCHQNLRWGCS